ncbi:MAG: RNA polymerase sigma factor [Spirochaetes bacterium]|nr:RNA polymerase sigma factor [Spirochaetota bacterium]
MIIIIFFADDDLKKIKKRDPIIFQKIYEEYGKKIYNYLLIKTNGDQDAAEELSAETFYSVLKSAPKLKKIKGLQAWIFQIASRRFNDHLRKKYKEKIIIEKSNGQQTLSNDHLDDLMLKEKILMLNMALENLNDQYKKVIKLKYIEHKSQKEIAQIINKSVVAVESLLFKARKKLKTELKKNNRDFFS